VQRRVREEVERAAPLSRAKTPEDIEFSFNEARAALANSQLTRVEDVEDDDDGQSVGSTISIEETHRIEHRIEWTRRSS
jgi:hypothetical protein